MRRRHAQWGFDACAEEKLKSGLVPSFLILLAGYEGWENAGKKSSVWFNFTSNRARKWREICQPITVLTKKNQNTREFHLTLDENRSSKANGNYYKQCLSGKYVFPIFRKTRPFFFRVSV